MAAQVLAFAFDRGKADVWDIARGETEQKESKGGVVCIFELLCLSFAIICSALMKRRREEKSQSSPLPVVSKKARKSLPPKQQTVVARLFPDKAAAHAEKVNWICTQFPSKARIVRALTQGIAGFWNNAPEVPLTLSGPRLRSLTSSRNFPSSSTKRKITLNELPLSFHP